MGGGLLLAERFGLLFEERNQAPWEPTPHCGQVGETPRLCSRIVRHAMFLPPHCGLVGGHQLCSGIVQPVLPLTPHCGQVGGHQRLCSGIVEPVQSPAPHCGLTGVRQRLCSRIVRHAMFLILHCGQVGRYQLSQRVCWATFQRAQPRTVGTDSALRTSWRTPIDYAVA